MPREADRRGVLAGSHGAEDQARPENRRRETATILLADDDESVRVTLGAVLTEAGHTVSLCTSGSEVLALLESTEFDVILTDFRLGDMDGIVVVDEARRRWPETVPLMLTGYASLESAIDALRVGVYDYLRKPCPTDELLATVARAIERRRLRIALRRQTRDLETTIETARELHSALSSRLEGTTALLREREHVLVTVCTELRASLIAIAGLVELLLSRDGGDDIGSSLEKIRLEAQSLAQRVTDALNITRSDSVEVRHQTSRVDLLDMSLVPTVSEPTATPL
jgi:DNA-binding response OmpR family regulator